MLTYEQEEQLINEANKQELPFQMKWIFDTLSIPFTKGNMISFGFTLRKNGYYKHENNVAVFWRKDWNKLLIDLSPSANVEELKQILTNLDSATRKRLLEALLDTVKM